MRDLPFRAWSPQDDNRLDRLTLCPVHFEQCLEGELATVVRVGSNFLTEPAELELPQDLMANLAQACDGLDLHLVELGLRQTPEGGWACTSLYPFLRPRMLADKSAAEVVAEFFEEASLP